MHSCVCVRVRRVPSIYIYIFYSQGHDDDAARSLSSKPHSRPTRPPTHPPIYTRTVDETNVILLHIIIIIIKCILHLLRAIMARAIRLRLRLSLSSKNIGLCVCNVSLAHPFIFYLSGLLSRVLRRQRDYLIFYCCCVIDRRCCFTQVVCLVRFLELLPICILFYILLFLMNTTLTECDLRTQVRHQLKRATDIIVFLIGRQRNWSVISSRLRCDVGVS